MARDGGHLIMEASEADALVRDFPEAAEFIRRFGGAKEAISGEWRRCLWIPDDRAIAAAQIPPIAARLERVRVTRAASKAGSTRALADAPHRFAQRAHKDTPAMIVPRVSSERRAYVPMDFVGPDTVISDLAHAVYDAEPWLFGLLQSHIHMCWVAAVGGRMKSDYRYTAGLVYNTFPLPQLDDETKRSLHTCAVGVLAAREQFPDQTLAELYDPEKMPPALREAHRRLDETADRLYLERGFASDDERLEMLFEMYESRTNEAERTLASA
jgi:hypothetical protein